MAPRTIPPSYIRVRAVVWEFGDGQTHRHTEGRDQYTFRFGYASREASQCDDRSFLRGWRHLANTTKNSAVSPACEKKGFDPIPTKARLLLLRLPCKNWTRCPKNKIGLIK